MTSKKKFILLVVIMLGCSGYVMSKDFMDNTEIAVNETNEGAVVEDNVTNPKVLLEICSVKKLSLRPQRYK